jgi:HEAT repeat protein
MFLYRAALVLIAATITLPAQDVTRPKDVKEIAKGGTNALPRLRQLLKNPSAEIRLEAVKHMVDIGTQYSLDPLVEAAQDNDPEIQIRAIDGLVNFYLPGYVKTGFGGSLRKMGTGVKGKFTDTNDQVIDPFIQVRPDVIAALGKLVRGGARMDVRATSARAIGILRGKAAVPDMVEAVKSKDNNVIVESLVAFQKIHDESAGPGIVFLLHDFDSRVQIAAIETTGLLRNKAAVPNLIEVLNRAREAKVRRAALSAIAMVPVPSSRDLFALYLADKDDRMRGAAAEGFGRLKNPADAPLVEKAYEAETKSSPRISMAFAVVSLGKTGISEFSPLQYLINMLNSSSWNGEAFPFLVELAREAGVRAAIYTRLPGGTKAEKLGLARVLARSGDKESIAPLQKLQSDADGDVAQEALRAVRTLQSRP